MPRLALLFAVAALMGGLAACGYKDDAPKPAATGAPGTPGTPQGPAPRAGLRGGDLPTGGTLTGAPASALARVGDTVYAAGVKWVGPLRGSALALRPRTGSFAKAFGTNGQVSDAVADGRGGVYLAGDFDRVGSRRRRGLVHVFSTGEVDRRFRPRTDGSVAALARDGAILYAGGSPDGPRGPGARGVVALNAGTGAPLPGFETDLAPGVTELEVRGGTLYVGGSSPGLRRFAERQDETEAPLVALDARSGERQPGFVPAPFAAGRFSVSALRVIDGRLWMGRSMARRRDAALSLLDPGTGATLVDTGVRGTVRQLLRDDDRVLALGSLRGRAGRDLAQALDPATGARRSGFRIRAPRVGGAGEPVARAGVVRGDELWLGGQRGSRTAGRGGFVGAYDLRTGAPQDQITAPVPDGPVNTLVSAGGRVVAGGDFAAVDVRRQDLAAFSATTGRYAAGARLPPTRSASTLVAAAGRLWVVDGSRLLVVDPASGRVTKQIALPRVGARPGAVRLAVAGGRIFVAGAALGAPGPLAFDAATAARVPFRLPLPSADRRPPVLLGDGATLWVGGSFERTGAGGGSGKRSVLRLDARTGKLDPSFDPRVNGPVRGLALAGDRLYVTGRFTRVGELRRRNLAAVEPATGAAIAAFEPGPVRAGDHVRLERLGAALLVTSAAGTARAFDAEGGPAARSVKGVSHVSATAPGAGGSQLVAGSLRSSATREAGRRRGVVLPPRC